MLNILRQNTEQSLTELKKRHSNQLSTQLIGKFKHQPHLKQQTHKLVYPILDNNKDQLYGGGNGASVCSSENRPSEIRQPLNGEDLGKLNKDQRVKLYQLFDKRRSLKNGGCFYNRFLEDYIEHSEKRRIYQIMQSEVEYQYEINQMMLRSLYDYREILYLIPREKMVEVTDVITHYLVFIMTRSHFHRDITNKKDLQEFNEKTGDCMDYLHYNSESQPYYDARVMFNIIQSVNKQREPLKLQTSSAYTPLLTHTFIIMKKVFSGYMHQDLDASLRAIVEAIGHVQQYFLSNNQKYGEIQVKNVQEIVLSNYCSKFSDNFYLYINLLWASKADRFRDQLLWRTIPIDQEIAFYIEQLNVITLPKSDLAIQHLFITINQLFSTRKDDLIQLIQEQKIKGDCKQTMITFSKMLLFKSSAHVDKPVMQFLPNMFKEMSNRYLIFQMLQSMVLINGLYTKKEYNQIYNHLCLRYLNEPEPQVKSFFRKNPYMYDYVQELKIKKSKKKDQQNNVNSSNNLQQPQPAAQPINQNDIQVNVFQNVLLI